MMAPRRRKASIISAESRECNGARNREGPSARAARTRYRLVRDLEPGTVTVASTGRSAKGARQCGRAPAGREEAAAVGVVPVIAALGSDGVVDGLADRLVGLLQLLAGGLPRIGGEGGGGVRRARPGSACPRCPPKPAAHRRSV